MAGPSRDPDDDLITDINVTPLVDVVLVLLIILMVTATAIVSAQHIRMELPQAATGEQQQEQETLAVSIDKDGHLFLNAAPMSLEALRAGVRREKAAHPDLRAVIAADGRVSHAQVVRIIDVLRQEGVTRFAINVRPEDLNPR